MVYLGLPIKNCDFPWLTDKKPEGKLNHQENSDALGTTPRIQGTPGTTKKTEPAKPRKRRDGIFLSVSIR
jgi:hypothetical protein